MSYVKTYLPWVIALLALTAAIYGYYHPKIDLQTNETVVLKTLPGKTVYKLKDCEIIGPKPTSEVIPIITGVIPKSPYGGEVVTNLTPSTEELSMTYTPKSRSLFGFENDKEVGLRYGFREEVNLFGRWTFVRVGAIHGAFYAEASMATTDTTASNMNAMVELSYRW